MWSIVCLLVDEAHRGQGLTRELIEAAVEHAAGCGASIVEAYPMDPTRKPMPPAFAWTGLASAFRQAGFQEVARRAAPSKWQASRPVMRRVVAVGSGPRSG